MYALHYIKLGSPMDGRKHGWSTPWKGDSMDGRQCKIFSQVKPVYMVDSMDGRHQIRANAWMVDSMDGRHQVSEFTSTNLNKSKFVISINIWREII